MVLSPERDSTIFAVPEPAREAPETYSKEFLSYLRLRFTEYIFLIFTLTVALTVSPILRLVLFNVTVVFVAAWEETGKMHSNNVSVAVIDIKDLNIFFIFCPLCFLLVLVRIVDFNIFALINQQYMGV